MPLGVTRTYVKSVDVGTLPAGRAAPSRSRAATSATTRRASRPARPRRCTGGDDGIVDFDKSAASAARPASPPVPTTRSSSTPRTTPPRSATSARTGWTSGSSRPASSSAPSRRSSSAISTTRPRRSPDRPAESPSRFGARRRRRARSSSTRARTRRRSTRSLRAAPRAASSCGASRGRFPSRSPPATRGRRTRSAAALLSYDMPHRAPVGLAGLPLHVDEGDLGRRVPGRRSCSRSPGCSRSEARSGSGRRRCGRAGVPRAHRSGSDRRPRASAQRFVYIFLRPQWRSWLVRGAVLISGYGAVLALHLLLSAAGVEAAAEVARGRGRPAGRDRPSTRPTSSRRRRRAISGRARCCRRTCSSRRVLAGAAALLPFVRLARGGAAMRPSGSLRAPRSPTSSPSRRGHAHASDGACASRRPGADPWTLRPLLLGGRSSSSPAR